MYKYWKFKKCNEDFPVKLRNLRLAEGLTQTQLAQKLNISRSSVSNYESGMREPNSETLRLIAETFDVLVDYLVGKTEYSTLPFEKDKVEEFHTMCRRIKEKGDVINISGIPMGKKIAIINFCEYILSSKAE